MRLRRLDLTRYGKFTDYSIDFGEATPGEPDLHIVYGLNEAGKSTSLSAYLDLLFGIEERTRYGFLHQSKSMEIGGCLEFGGAVHEFKRVKQRNNSLLDSHGQPVNEAVLSVPLAGLSRDAYRMMFSLDDHTLEEGGNAILESRGDLGELLFSASAGLAGTASILDGAIGEAQEIFRKRARSTKIATLKQQIIELKAQRDEIDTQTSAYTNLKSELQRSSAAYDQAMTETAAARARRDEVARILRAYPLMSERQTLLAAFRPYQELPRPPLEWNRSLSALIDAEARLQTRKAGLEARVEQLRGELEELSDDAEILAYENRIERLSEAAARYLTAEEDLPKRKDALAKQLQQLNINLVRLGKESNPDAKALVVPAATIGVLRELLTEQTGVQTVLQSAMKEFQNSERALEDLKVEQEARHKDAALDPVTLAGLQSTLERIRQSELIAELKHAEQVLKEATANYESLALGRPGAKVEDPREIAVLDEAQIDLWRGTAQSLESRLTRLSEQIEKAGEQVFDAEARVKALRSTGGVISDQEAQAAQEQRDQAWRKHLSRLDVETASSFEVLMRDCDRIAEQRIRSGKDLEELRRLEADIVVCSDALKRLQGELRDTELRLAALREEIRARTSDWLELDPEMPTASWLMAVERWAQAHARAVDAFERMQLAQRRLDQVQRDIADEHAALCDILGKRDLAVEGEAFAVVIRAGENLLAAHTASQLEKANAEKQITQASRAVARRQDDLEAARANLADWERRWDEAIEQSWLRDRKDSPTAVRELLDIVSELPAQIQALSETRHRVEAMEADRKAFADTIAELAHALETSAGKSPLDTAAVLQRRLEQARHTRTRRKDKQREFGDAQAEIDVLHQDLALHDSRKLEMTSFFGVETLTELQQALDAVAQRNRIEEDLERVNRQILTETQAENLDSGLELLGSEDRSALQQELAELEARLEDLELRAKNLFAERARAADRLEAVGGDDAVLRIEAQRGTLLLEMEEQALRYLRLRSGSLIAEHAIRAYRDKHRSAMMQRASDAFRLMTRGDYTGLTTMPEKDREVLIGLPANGGSKLAADMSKGTRFQLYLALRLAGYEEFASARPSVPFVADDIMETFDEPRSEEVMRLFGEMSRVGQVIYLTHHRHLCDLAAKAVPSVKIHEIAS
ncbi:ATP-binding protein [Aquamicrobium zhengzhouense]|uniref:AAA family ATPase n=1 Tax=Aquamicrobium zhengzhouense TaxID=2781738 RepID=A0ABS0SE67_9HYPH|nr:AAA family ATPase [Aquamicrobium zhengzhouense]MBI1621590.1 AAA family ATPase [Aquamicrobium zhengzhouense]